MRNFKNILSAFLICACALLLCACASKKVVATSQQQVMQASKTLTRDSVIFKDSTIIHYIDSIVRRDSVVLKIDRQTGGVVSKDTWHWVEKSSIKDKAAVKTADRAKTDSTSTYKEKKDSVVATAKPQGTAKAKSHWWKWYLFGLISGILIVLIVRYRKKVFSFLPF